MDDPSSISFRIDRLPAKLIDQILGSLPLADCLRLSATSKGALASCTEHLVHRNQISVRDLPARTVRASHILKTLMSIKQPNRLSLCLMLLPDVSSRGLTPPRTFPDHLCSLQHLTSITILIDEPRTNSYFMELGAKEDLCMVAKCLEAICLSAAPVHTVVAGGLRYLNSADLSRGLFLMAAYKPTVRSLHLIRLENLTGSDLMLLTSDTPERTSWCGQVAEETSLERLSSSLPSSLHSDSGLEFLSAHIQQASQASHVRSSRERMSADGSYSWPGAAVATTGCVAQRLTAFSVMECSKVSDEELAAFLAHTANLEFVSLVPDDFVTSAQPLYAAPGGAAQPPGHPVGVESLSALAAAAPKRLRHLYLSEELSPSSFGDAALAPVLAVATGLEELCLNIPVSDEVLGLLARNCRQLQRLTLLASNVSDGALAPVFEACSHLHSVTLCGSPYFGSRDIQGSFLGALFKRSKALTNVSLDCMHNVTARKLCSMLLSCSQTAGGPRNTGKGADRTSAAACDTGAAGERAAMESLGSMLFGREGSGVLASQLESLRLPSAASMGGNPASEAAAAAALAGFASLDPPPAASTGLYMRVQGRLSDPTEATRGSRGAGEHWWEDVMGTGDRSSAGGAAVSGAARRSSAAGQLTRRSDGHWIPAELPSSLPASSDALEAEGYPDMPAAPRYTEASASSWGYSGNGSLGGGLGMHGYAVSDGEALLQSLTTLALDHMPKLREGGPGGICALLAHAPHLLSLSLQGYDGPIDCVLEAAVLSCPSLTSVTVGGCRNLSDRGLLQLCHLAPQLSALHIQSCALLTPQAIQKVLAYHLNTLESVDLWGTRACGSKTAALLTSGRLRRVNIGGTLIGGTALDDGLLRRVLNDISASSVTEVTTIAQSALLSHRVMFAPGFHEVLASSRLVDV